MCALGIHRWIAKSARFNPARIVRRCKRCSSVRVRLLEPRPSPPCLIHERIELAIAQASAVKAAPMPRQPNDALLDGPAGLKPEVAAAA